MRGYLRQGIVTVAVLALVAVGGAVAPAVAQDPPVGAVLTFEGDGLDTGDPHFVNQAFVGGQLIADLPAAVGYATVEVPIPAAQLSSGETEVVIASTPAIAGGPVDAFVVRDVRLVLPDGSELRDRDHEPGSTYEITGAIGDTKILAPGKYNPRRRYLFWLPPVAAGEATAAPDIVAAVAGSADAKPLREDSEAVADEVPSEQLAALADADGHAVTTEVPNGFAYQQFDVGVPDDDSSHALLEWQGASRAGGGASLFGFDHDLGRWVEVAAGDEPADDAAAGGTIALTATLDRDSFVRDGVARVLVTERQFGPDDADATIAWVTDSQFQTQANLRPLDLPGQIADWLVANHEQLGIDYMAYTGDLAENGGVDPTEFTYISEALQPLDDAGFPYGVVPGNHDYTGFGIGPGDQLADTLGTDPDLAVYAHYFGAHRFEGRPWYGEQFRNNENHYDIVELGGRKLAFLYMGWDAQPEEFAWAEAQLQGPLRDIPVVFATHEYLNLGETMRQKGVAILERLVLPHDNVFAIISGHYHGVAYQVRRTDDGRVVLELLHDYQDETEAGAAYFRLLHFDLDNQQLRSTEYSPHHDDFLIEGFDVRRQEYTLPLHLDDLERSITTDLLRIGTTRA